MSPRTPKPIQTGFGRREFGSSPAKRTKFIRSLWVKNRVTPKWVKPWWLDQNQWSNSWCLKLLTRTQVAAKAHQHGERLEALGVHQAQRPTLDGPGRLLAVTPTSRVQPSGFGGEGGVFFPAGAVSWLGGGSGKTG